MLDGVSLDQLRTFIAAAEEGNFSAAGRRLRRALFLPAPPLPRGEPVRRTLAALLEVARAADGRRAEDLSGRR